MAKRAPRPLPPPSERSGRKPWELTWTIKVRVSARGLDGATAKVLEIWPQFESLKLTGADVGNVQVVTYGIQELKD